MRASLRGPVLPRTHWIYSAASRATTDATQGSARRAAPERSRFSRLRGKPRHNGRSSFSLRGEPRPNLPNLTELLASWQDLRQTFDPVLASRAGAGPHDARLPGLDAESVKLKLAALKSLAGAVELADLADDGEEIDRTALLD